MKTNAATGAKFQVATTESGDYTIPSLPAGTYTLYSILVPPGADPLKLGPDLRTTDFSLVE